MSSFNQAIGKHLSAIGVSSLLALAPVVGVVTNFGQPLPAYAMTEAQALERLSSIPVFTITDNNGAPLLAAIPQQANRPQEARQLLVFFLNPDEAEATLRQVQTSNPTLARTAKISALPFSAAYKTVRDNRDRTLAFQFVASRASLDSARTLIRAQGRPETEVPPLPVFFATSGTGDRQGLLTIDSEGQQTVPFFLDQRDLQTLLDRARQQQPNLARDTQIQVTSLFVVLENMITRNNQPNPDAQRFQFVPSRVAFEYVLRLSGTPATATPANRPGTPARPATPPARPATPAPARPATPPPPRR